MRRVFLVWALVLLAVTLVLAAGEPLRITAPAATGMNTDFDGPDLRPTDARYLLNTNITDKPGVLKNRFGHKVYGANTQAMSAAVGVYDERTHWKTVFGFCPSASMRVGRFKILGDSVLIDSELTFSTADTPVAVVRRSANYGASVGPDSVPYWWFDYRGLHDFCAGVSLGQVHVSNTSPACIFTPVSPVGVLDTVYDSLISDTLLIIDTIIRRNNWWWPPTYDTIYDTLINSVRDTVVQVEQLVRTDTISYNPRIVPLSLPPPGSPTVFALNNLDSLDVSGTFRYAVTFSATDMSGRYGTHGPVSNIVSVTSGAVALTNLPRFAWAGDNDSTALIILREDIVKGGGLRPLDSIAFSNDDTVVYVDGVESLPDTGAYFDSIGATLVSPGMPGFGGFVNGPGQYTTGGFYIAISYLDTVLNLESAIGLRRPFYAGGAGKPLEQLLIGVSAPCNAVRVYLSVTDPVVVGYNDSTIMWAYKDIPVPPGNYREVNCIIGDMADTILVDTGGVIDESGNTIQRPSYLSHLSTTLTDVEFFDEVLWGIGDPEFPSRLYFSGSDFGDWDPTNSYDLAPADNDKIVAIEKISLGTEEGLLAFKRRSTWLVTGATVNDMEFLDGQLWQSSTGDPAVICFTKSLGAISRDLVIKRGDALYVVTNDLRCVRFRGTRIDTISTPVWSEFKTAITDTSQYLPPGKYRQSGATSYNPADVHAKAMLKDDNVLFLNQFNFTGMAWNVVSETWSRVQYTFADVPTGTFKYDTVSAPALFGDDNDLFFFDGAALPFYVTDETTHQDTTNGSYQTIYRTPDIVIPGTMIWLRSLTLSMNFAGPDVRVRVMSTRGDTLATRTITDNNLEDVIIGFRGHAAPGLRIEIAAINDTGAFELYELSPDIVPVGQIKRR